jgi:uncharacterized protein
MNKRLSVAIAVAAGVLAFAGAAQAHVTLHPNALASGGFTQVVVRVPNERPTAATTKVDVKFPSGFIFLSYEALPGWKTKVIYRNLAKPVTVFGETFKQEVDRVVWTGNLPPGQFVEFPLSIGVPAVKAGTILTFKALQTYDNGEVVRWIGPPDADEPAPQVMVRGADSPVQDFPSGISAIKKAGTAQLASQPAAASASESGSDNGEGRANLALGFGIAGLAVGLIALGLMLVRRRRHA